VNLSGQCTRFLGLILAMAALLAEASRPARAFVVNVGDVLVASYDTWTVVRLDPRTGEQVVFGTFLHPMDVALRSSGVLYIGEFYGDIQMLDVAAETVTPMVLTGDLPTEIWGLTIGPNGRLYVTGKDLGDVDSVFEVNLDTGASTLITQGNLLSGVAGVTTLDSTHLVVSCALANRLVSISLVDHAQSTIISGGLVDSPYDVAVYGSKLFTGAYDSKWLLEVSGGNATVRASLLGSPWGIDVDSHGTIAVGVKAVGGGVQLLDQSGNSLGSYASADIGWAAGLEIAKHAVLGPPSITTQPQSQTVNQGDNVTFAVVASGSPPFSYQWYFNQTQAIPWGVTSTLTITNVQPANAGSYSVVVHNGFSVTSSNAWLTVNRLPVPAAPVLERAASLGAKRRVADFLGADPDGDPVSLTAAGPTSIHGGTVQVTHGWVAYTPPAGWTTGDAFSFTVSDGQGGIASGTASVVVPTDDLPTENLITEPAGGNATRLRGDGIPGRTYALEYSESLEFPNWQRLAVLVADSHGSFAYVDAPAAGAPPRFYRAVEP